LRLAVPKVALERRSAAGISVFDIERLSHGQTVLDNWTT